jgi:hypothetical protein
VTNAATALSAMTSNTNGTKVYDMEEWSADGHGQKFLRS